MSRDRQEDIIEAGTAELHVSQLDVGGVEGTQRLGQHRRSARDRDYQLGQPLVFLNLTLSEPSEDLFLVMLGP